MRKLLNNKLFIILLIFLLLVTTYSSVFAVSDDNVVFTDYPECIITYVNDNFSDSYSRTSYDYIFIFDGVNYQVHFIDKNYKVYTESLSKIITNYNQKYIIIALSDGEISGVSQIYTSSNGIINFSTSSSDNITYISLYSTCNIYTDNTYSTIFFRPAPQGITLTLVEETTKAQIMEQMRIMIVGFLKYLIALVVSVVAFWKGWQLLSTQLKKA